MKQKILSLFITSSVFLLFLYACDCNDEPCIDCPIDFNVIDFEPAWSPDGQRIAFYHSGDSDKSGIYLTTPNGESVEQWHAGAVATPTWSPDGNWIAFSYQAQIWKKKLNGDSLAQLTFEGRNFFPTWSPDGKWIAYDAFIEGQTTLYAIWKMKYDGNSKTLIAYSPDIGAVRMPHWIGDNIVHIRYIEGTHYSEIFTMDSVGENVTRLTYNDAIDEYPKLSTDGTKIIFNSQNPNIPYARIWTMNADGSNLKQLTQTQAYRCDWSPCGNFIVYTDSRLENGRLWIMNADGSNMHQLTYEHHFNP